MSRLVFVVLSVLAVAVLVRVSADERGPASRAPFDPMMNGPNDFEFNRQILKDLAQQRNDLIKRAQMKDCFDQQKLSQCFFRLSAPGFRLPVCTAEALHNVSLQIDESSCCPLCRPAKCDSLEFPKLVKLEPCKVPLNAALSQADFAASFFDGHLCPKCNFLQVVQRPGHEKPEDKCDLLHIPACPVDMRAAAAAAIADPATFSAVDMSAFIGPDDDCNISNSTCSSVCPRCRKLPLALCPPGRLPLCLTQQLPVCAVGAKPALGANCCPTCRPASEVEEVLFKCGKKERTACARKLLPPCADGVAPVFNASTCCFDCIMAPLLVPDRDAAHPRKCTEKEASECVANQPVCPDGVLPIFNLSMCCMSCKRPEEKCSPREVAKCRSMTKPCPQNMEPFHADDLCCPVCVPAPKVCHAPRSCAAHSERCGFKRNVAVCRNVSHVHLHLRNITDDTRSFFRNMTAHERLDFFIELVERFCRLTDNVPRCVGVLEALRDMELSDAQDDGDQLSFNATVVPPDADDVADSNLTVQALSPSTATLLAYTRLFENTGDASSSAALTASVLTDALNSNTALAGDPVLFSASAAVAADGTTTSGGAPTNNGGTPNGADPNNGAGGNNSNNNSPAQNGAKSDKLPSAALYAIIAGGVVLLAAVAGVVVFMRSRSKDAAAHALSGVEMHSGSTA